MKAERLKSGDHVRIVADGETGTCTPPGAPSPQRMTKVECEAITSCFDWHVDDDPSGSLEWTPVRTPVPRAAWDPSLEVFGQLGQVLAATYARRMSPEAAHDEVIRKLSQLIAEAAEVRGCGNGRT